ncbi:FAD/NAD-P-binding domain-containing protein [Cytidiella melzeri]|nr:FAD/NAD-P-binding domain-containing protein [Cytidiella melzeri]
MTALILSTLLLSLAVSSTANPAAWSQPVCIVGAGPGGLTIAHELEAKGYHTVVFDKQPTVGGKCQEYYDGPANSIYHPLGALLFTNLTYANTLPLIQAANLPLTPGISMQNGWQYWLYGPGNKASEAMQMPAITDSEEGLIAEEYARYTAYWTTTFAPLYSSLRYVHGVPADLTVPFSEWLSTNEYLALPSVMEPGMVPYGYGDITQTPTIYMLQYFTPEILGAFLGLAQSYIVDYHKVFVQYSNSIRGPLHLNAAVTNIDRTGHTPVVTYTVRPGIRATQKCSDVVLAFPPTLENLAAIDMPLSSSEKSVFSKVGITAYWSSATVTQIDHPFFFQQHPPEPLGAPVGFLRLFDGSPITTTYSWGPAGSTMSIEEAKELLASTLTRVQTGAGIAHPTVTVRDVKAIRKWDYFPHFASSDLAGGIYASYNALQGQRHTYYSSGLNGFETVEFAIRAGKDLVASYF